MVRRRIRARTLLLLLGTAVMLGASGAVLLVTLDWRPRLERYLSRTLDRRLAIAALRIGWGSPLAIELTGIRLANAPSGSATDMASIERLSAEIALPALLRGILRFDRLRIENPRLLLERDADGIGNWRFAGGGSAAAALAIVPKNRTQFPTLIDFALHDGEIIYRATASDLHIDLHAVAIGADDDDKEVGLTADGAYNGVATRLAATTDSYAALRDAALPFAGEFTLASAAGTVDFKGTMEEPLDFDGARGKIAIDTGSLGAFLHMLGADLSADFPFVIGGAFERSGTHWRIAEADGRVAADRFTGELSIAEGARGTADGLAATLDFAALDLAPLIGAGRAGKPIALRPESDPGVTVEAHIAAGRLSYEARHLADVAIALRTRPGEIEASKLSFAFAGGKVSASGTAQIAGSVGRLAVTAALTGAEAEAAASALGVAPGQIAGRLDGRLTLAMSGATLDDALKASSSGEAVLAMAGGRISRDLIERASTDLHTLFRAGEGSVPLSCLLGIARLRDGVAMIAPLRLRTPATTLVAYGRANLVSERLDIMLRTEHGSTGFLALALPLHITGSFDKPRIAPSAAADPGAVTDPGHLATIALQLLAERSPCRH